MGILLDTHTLIWWLTDAKELGAKARDLISDETNEIFISAVSSWEISIKRNLGKLRAPDNIDKIVESEGFSMLAISLAHGDASAKLPLHHKDPFDRMLIVQAQMESLIIHR